MPSDSDTLKTPEDASRLFARDQTAGFAVLTRLLADRPIDGADGRSYAHLEVGGESRRLLLPHDAGTRTGQDDGSDPGSLSVEGAR